MENTVIVLAMHGAPPTDFPPEDAAELFILRGRMEHAGTPDLAALEQRYAALETKMRQWPRTADNDPFFAGSQKLASRLTEAAGCPVIVGFNEFCAPALSDALDQAAAMAGRVIVVTPMMTRGGDHSEREIPEFVDQARRRHPNVTITYAWPFDSAEIARFLAGQINRFV